MRMGDLCRDAPGLKLAPIASALGFVTYTAADAASMAISLVKARKKAKQKATIWWPLFLAPPAGLEPATLRLTAACSTD